MGAPPLLSGGAGDFSVVPVARKRGIGKFELKPVSRKVVRRGCQAGVDGIAEVGAWRGFSYPLLFDNCIG